MTCVARNILLLSLILDDTDDSNHASIWSIYYHLYLSDASMNMLSTQAKTLHSLAVSLQSWNGSKYGQQMRICDQGTLNEVRDLWRSYCVTDLSYVDRKDFFRNLKTRIQKALDVRAHFTGPTGKSFILTGIRSAAPAGIRAVEDLPKLYHHYWDHGSTDPANDDTSKDSNPNPMFNTLGTETLHYGTDPLLGFHLATAYTPLTEKSPLYLKSATPAQVVEAARLQFRTWAMSWRKRHSHNLTLRFFTGDAIAFSYALQQRAITKTEKPANLYRDPYHLKPLILDSDDYSNTGDAPLSFTVIDTSNLVDHVGAINLLVALSPLLDRRSSASLFTESLVKHQENHTAYVDSILCGHFPTISILLGLFPVEYWTNASATSTADDLLMDTHFLAEKVSDERRRQMRVKMSWKRQIPAAPIRFDEAGCAQVLYQVYLNMFQHENMQRLFSNLNMQTMRNNSNLHYHRGSFVLFLRLIRSRIVVDWNKMMNILLDLIEHDSNLLMGSNYIQELYLHLHLLDIFSVDTFKPSFFQNVDTPTKTDLRGWKDIPTSLCVTLRVPRDKLGILTKLKLTEIGTPILHCVIQSSQMSTTGTWQNIFSSVQLSFGAISTSGPRNSNAFEVHVTEDNSRWVGSSALFVSFRVPTWILLLEPQTARVAFGIQSTPQSSMTFMRSLGPDMNIHEVRLGNENDVFITKDLPNCSKAASLCDISFGNSMDLTKNVVTAGVDSTNGRVMSVTARLEILSDDVKSILQSGGLVKSVQISPCSFALAVGVGKKAFRIPLTFPVPVLQKSSKTRIARKSSYIEIEAPLAGEMDFLLFPEFMYPKFLEKGKPLLWNMTFLNLECLPIIDISRPSELQWLITHTSGMFTSRERALRDKPMGSGSATDVRVTFKDGLFSMFMQFSGLQGKQAHLFGLNNPDDGGIHVLIFVSCLRLDITNATVVLDVAVLPLTNKLAPQLYSFLAALTRVGICSIKVDADELRLWREVLPTMVDRCRTWEHRPSCEYATESRIPISVENGQTPLCSCGNGKLPAKFITDVPNWNDVSKYFVRAAIPPCFPAPFAEPIFDFKSICKVDGSQRETCRLCGRDKAKNGTGLLSCGRCREVKYCSVECQRKDWKKHKSNCRNSV